LKTHSEFNFKAGDLVSHNGFRKTIGFLVEKLYVGKKKRIMWEVFWLHHPLLNEPEEYRWQVLDHQWLRPFKPWPGFYNKMLDKSGSK